MYWTAEGIRNRYTKPHWLNEELSLAQLGNRLEMVKGCLSTARQQLDQGELDFGRYLERATRLGEAEHLLWNRVEKVRKREGPGGVIWEALFIKNNNLIILASLLLFASS